MTLSLLLFVHVFCRVMLQDLRKMVDRIRKFQILNDQIFAFLNRYLSSGHDHVAVEHFSPPDTNRRSSVA